MLRDNTTHHENYHIDSVFCSSIASLNHTVIAENQASATTSIFHGLTLIDALRDGTAYKH